MSFSKSHLKAIVAGAVILIAAPTALAQSVLYVDNDALTGGDGLTWDTAYRFLQDALADAAAGTEIRVAQGVYLPDQDQANPNGTGDREATFRLVNGVVLMGGYAGLGEADPDARDIELFETVLSGDIGTPDSWWDNSYHVVTGSGTDESTVLDGLTITAGHANAESPNGTGGGFLNENGNLSVLACRFVDNHAVRGSGMANIDSSPTVIDCTFSSNGRAADEDDGYGYGGRGGGMYNLNSHPVVTGCTFSENIIAHVDQFGWGYGGPGGGIYNENSHPSITDCTFTGNVAHLGGGVYNYMSSPAIHQCVFTDNAALTFGSLPHGGFDFGLGGGICNEYDSDSTVTDCVFTGNSGPGSGLGNTLSSPTVTNCDFVENESGIYNKDSSPTVSECVFSSNEYSGMTNGSGGDPWHPGSHPTVVNCTFTGNGKTGMVNWGTSPQESRPVVIGCSFTGNSTSSHSGGMHGGQPTVIGCTFTGNSSSNWAGGMHHSGGLILSCTFRNNTGSTGGGMYTGYGIVANCLFANNTASRGGGVFGGEPIIANCTFVDNVALEEGGGMFSCSQNGPLVSNCIFRGNSAGTAGSQVFFCDYEGLGVPRFAFSNIQGSGGSAAWDADLGTDGGGNIDADPMFVDPDNDDYRLLPGSPCIDAGNNNAVAQHAASDLDGNPRFADDSGTADTGCGVPVVVDMGAYEFQGDPADVVFADLTGDGIIGLDDFETLLNCWASSEEPCCLADLDLDGTVGIVDFLILLGNWG
jgi:parallel beta-helix repeat protein